MPIISRLDNLRRVLVGSPSPTSAQHEERFNNADALAILSSDALSLVAYATQEIVQVLGMAGSAALGLTLPITGLVAGASLSIDYLLTVAVSVAAGIAALTSYFPGLDT
jgi:hypothetical protein